MEWLQSMKYQLQDMVVMLEGQTARQTANQTINSSSKAQL
jgi:hypothetical protein